MRPGRTAVATPTATMAIGGMVAIAAVVFLIFGALPGRSYDTWGALLIGPMLLAITLPLARSAGRAENDPRLARLIMVAVALKLLAALVRYVVVFDVYGGSADAAVYIRDGMNYGDQLRQGIFAYDRPSGGSDGTHFITQAAGVVFAIIGRTGTGAFLVFSWLGFLGLYSFYRAFRLAVPHGDHRRYALLIFFLPSLLFWPSSIGKESWMLFTLGLGSYGAARILGGHHGGYLLVGLGVLGTAAVRPHMTALLAAGLLSALLLRRSAGRATRPLVKVVGATVGLAVMFYAVQTAEQRFGVEGQGLSGAEQIIDDTAERTSQGGSEFEGGRPQSLRDIPFAIFTVIFRPLPYEAHNSQALMTSLEGLLLLGLFAISLPRLKHLPREIWRTPYVTFAAVYSLLFMLAFSSLGNFGILARQRAQLFPLLVVVLALPKLARWNDTRPATTPLEPARSPEPHTPRAGND